MTHSKGQCHCGALKVDYESTVDPAETIVRECQCSFCRLHAMKAISDPAGKACFTEQAAGTLRRYRFGLNTADYLICTICGTYIGCILTATDQPVAIVNIRTLENQAAFTSPPIAAVYDAETPPQRIARRKANWTPAQIIPAT